MAKIKAVAYARYSSDRQQESSITVQIAAIRKFCESNHIELIREYIDEAQTGTNANRKQFQQMMQDAPDREFQLVVVHRLDRWARNVDDARYYKKLLSRYGVKMVSAIEEFDETPEGEFFELMSMGMAELYSKKLSREAIAGKIANAKLGKIYGGIPPLGYKVKGKYYVIEETEAEAVKIIFGMAANGYGYRAIRNYLNENGYRRADGREFTAAFTDTLRNRRYIGEYIYRQGGKRKKGESYNSHSKRDESEVIRIPNGMPRIIDDDTFNQVQRLLDMRKKGMAGFTRLNRKYLLSGLIRCPLCGKSLVGGTTTCHKRRDTVYMENRKGKKCPTRAISTEGLEDYVTNLFVRCLLSPENNERLIELVKICYIQVLDNLHKQKNDMKEAITEKEIEIKAVADKLATNDCKPLYKYYSEEIEGLNLEVRRLEESIIETKKNLASMPNFSPLLIERNAKSYRKRIQSINFAERQTALRELIQVILVDKETVEVMIQFHRLLDATYPILGSVLEVRDYVALLKQRHMRTFEFSKLRVKI